MVREKNHPVLFLSVPPLVILYAGQLFDRNGAVTAAVVILVLFSLVLSAERFIPVRSFRLVRFVFLASCSDSECSLLFIINPAP